MADRSAFTKLHTVLDNSTYIAHLDFPYMKSEYEYYINTFIRYI